MGCEQVPRSPCSGNSVHDGDQRKVLGGVGLNASLTGVGKVSLASSAILGLSDACHWDSRLPSHLNQNKSSLPVNDLISSVPSQQQTSGQ